VVSISLGSSKRNHKATAKFCGQEFVIERIGTDGSRNKAIELIRELDGKVDVFGLGGTDLYIYAGNKRYTFRESQKIARSAKITPVVDGSGVKNTLERKVIRFLEEQKIVQFKDKKVLLVCAVDRFGMAEALVAAGSNAVFGDLLFGLGLPVPLRSLGGLKTLARFIAPVISKLPIRLFYPTGERQLQNQPRFSRYFDDADIIAGDFHFIRRYMPLHLPGKMIVTNTVTAEDEDLLKARGVRTLVTTTPEIGGRSFGTNIIEGILVTLAQKNPQNMDAQDYERILEEAGISPRVTCLF
jgi:hypothetical protein